MSATREDEIRMTLFSGVLPCGHRAEKEDDNITIDHCFECGWSTPERKAADKVNDAAVVRGKAETELVKFAREGWPAPHTLYRLARKVSRAWQNEQFERGQLKKLRD